MIQQLDASILFWIQEHIRCGFLDRAMPLITTLGDGGLLWIALAIVFLLFRKTRLWGLAMGLALIIGLVIGNACLKPLIGRIRPFDWYDGITLLIQAPGDFSFPSGHTLSAFAAASALFGFDKRVGMGAITLAALIGFSRLYLFVHYPTDVLAGCALGVLFGVFSGFVVRRYSAKVWENG